MKTSTAWVCLDCDEVNPTTHCRCGSNASFPLGGWINSTKRIPMHCPACRHPLTVLDADAEGGNVIFECSRKGCTITIEADLSQAEVKDAIQALDGDLFDQLYQDNLLPMSAEDVREVVTDDEWHRRHEEAA